MTKQLEFNIKQAGPLSFTLFNIVFDELREYSKNATWAPENLDFQRHHCICDNVVPTAECATDSELMRCTLDTEAKKVGLIIKPGKCCELRRMTESQMPNLKFFGMKISPLLDYNN